jgi:hypothetical protein
MGKLVNEDGVHIVEDDDIEPPPHYRPDGPPQIVTPDTARQGPLGLPALYVLIGSLLLIGIAWWLIATFVH